MEEALFTITDPPSEVEEEKPYNWRLELWARDENLDWGATSVVFDLSGKTSDQVEAILEKVCEFARSL